MKVSVIIVTYNAMKWAKKCFSSLQNSSFPVETIVIDNGSTDGTQKFIQENFPEVIFTQSKENLGFGKANNLGIEMAYKNGADFFYLLNQDTWIFKDTIEIMLDFYSSHPKKDVIGILSPLHINGTENLLDPYFESNLIKNNKRNRLLSNLLLNSTNNSCEVKFINAAHWLIPKQTIETIGGFNPHFYHYGEDNEYANRVMFLNKKIIICLESKAVHDRSTTQTRLNRQKYIKSVINVNLLDPNRPESVELEIKSLKNSILKNLLLFKIKEFSFLWTQLIKIITNKKEIQNIKKQISTPGPSFLKLNQNNN